MLGDIIRAIIVSQDDFELAGEVADSRRISSVAGGLAVDVLILGPSVGVSGADCETLLYERPRMKIVAIAADGRHADLHKLRPEVVPLAEISPASLIMAIRGAGGAG